MQVCFCFSSEKGFIQRDSPFFCAQEKKSFEKVCVTKIVAYISTMNEQTNTQKTMTYAQANTTAAELTAHIANYKTRKDIECTAFVVLKNGMPVEAVKIAIDMILKAPKYKA